MIPFTAKENRLLKLVLQAMDRIDLIKYEGSLEGAIRKLFQEIIFNLKEILEVYSAIDLKAIANVTDLTERSLERNNREFLDTVHNLVEDLVKEFKDHAIKYSNIASGLTIREVKENEQVNILDIYDNADEEKKEFQEVIKNIRVMAGSFLKEANARNVINLKKYHTDFETLKKFRALTAKSKTDPLILFLY